MYCPSAVNGTGHSMDPHSPLLGDRYFCHLGNNAAEALLQGNAAGAPRRQVAIPSRPFCRPAQYLGMAWPVCQHIQAELVGVAAGTMGQFVDERLHEEGVLRMRHTTPGPKRNVSGTVHPGNRLVGNGIGRVRRFGWLVLANVVVLPGPQALSVIEASLEDAGDGRPVVVLPHIFFPAPDSLYRYVEMLGDQGGLINGIGGVGQPASEAATDIVRVQGDVVLIDSRNARHP